MISIEMAAFSPPVRLEKMVPPRGGIKNFYLARALYFASNCVACSDEHY